MVLGCFSWSSEGKLTLQHTMTCFQLCGNSLGKALSCYSMTMPLLYKVRSIQKCFVEISVEELDWPAQGPDLNTIKHLWDELERQLRARPNRPTSVPDLINAVVAEWMQIPAAMFQHLVESLRGRVEAVIAAKGYLLDKQVST